MGSFDRYFVEGLKTLWGLKEDQTLEVFYRKVRNKVGREYEYAVARIKQKGKRVQYRHLSQAVLDASKEIRQRGAIRLLKKDLVRLANLIQEIEYLMEEIKEHRKIIEELPEDLKREVVAISKTLKELGESLNPQGE